MPAKIIRCHCKYTYQDELYGSQMRVHTEGGTKDNRKYTYCVCGDVKKIFIKQGDKK